MTCSSGGCRRSGPPPGGDGPRLLAQGVRDMRTPWASFATFLRAAKYQAVAYPSRLDGCCRPPRGLRALPWVPLLGRSGDTHSTPTNVNRRGRLPLCPAAAKGRVGLLRPYPRCGVPPSPRTGPPAPIPLHPPAGVHALPSIRIAKIVMSPSSWRGVPPSMALEPPRLCVRRRRPRRLWAFGNPAWASAVISAAPTLRSVSLGGCTAFGW